MEAFKKLQLPEELFRSIEEMKFEKPSEIQEKAIPIVLEGRDLIGGSATGSGKTLVFSSCIIQNAVKGKGIQALIMTPTRELAEQVANSLKGFSKYKPLSVVAVYGGVSINPQMDALPKADVVVGTPGRILDHLERGTLNLSNVQTLVLDEADRMLDMGFIDDVEKIISQCKSERQTLLFSATIPKELADLSQRYMKNPEKVSAESYVDPKKLRQIYYDLPENRKLSLLVSLIKSEKQGLVMVFCNTQRNTDFVARNLKANGVEAMAIHGGLSQAKRNRTLATFHSHKVYVLVCTDVAARGLDIPSVSHVYNYDAPADSMQYIHRIGRTARAGSDGIAINLISNRDHENFSNVMRDYAITIENVPLPELPKVFVKKMEPRQGGRFGGARGASRGNFSGRGERGNFSGRGRSNSRSEMPARRNESQGYRPPKFGSASKSYR